MFLWLAMVVSRRNNAHNWRALLGAKLFCQAPSHVLELKQLAPGVALIGCKLHLDPGTAQHPHRPANLPAMSAARHIWNRKFVTERNVIQTTAPPSTPVYKDTLPHMKSPDRTPQVLPVPSPTLIMSQTPSPRASSDEQRPLLDSDVTSGAPTQAGWFHRQLTTALESLQRTLWPCVILAFFLELSNILLDASATSLYERAICEEYYRARGGLIGIWSSPSHCKVAPIQNELQLVRIWQIVYDGLSGASGHVTSIPFWVLTKTRTALLAALPLAILANRYSHRKVLACILGGFTAAVLWTIAVCAVPTISIRLVWLSSIFRLFGGGKYTAEILLATMLVRASKDGTRLRNLYWMYSAFALAELAGISFNAVASKLSIWLPVGLGLGLLCICFFIVAVMSETATTAQNTSLADSQGGGTPTRFGKILSQLRLQNMHIALPMLYAAALRMAVQGFASGLGLGVSEVSYPSPDRDYAANSLVRPSCSLSKSCS